jgi:hypothetical protein
LVALLLGAPPATASEKLVPYSRRPDIRSMRSRQYNGEALNHHADVKRGMLNTLAELEAFYPGARLIFLARDAEYLADLARVVLPKSRQSAISVMNISRTKRDEGQMRPLKQEAVAGYAAENGLSLAALKPGQRVVFVDTGFNGTVAKRIIAKLPLALKKRCLIHLLESENRRIPDSKVMKAGLSEDESVEIFEDYPHFTGSATDIVQVKGKWESVSEGLDSPDQAREVMRDLKYFAGQKETKSEFAATGKAMRDLVAHVTFKSKVSRARRPQLLMQLKDVGAEAFIKDLRSVVRTHHLKLPKVRRLAALEELQAENQ